MKLSYFDLIPIKLIISLTFPPMNTANTNTHVIFTSSSTITTTAVSSASDMVSINPAPAISVAGTRQDANFEIRLIAMENAIFKLVNTLEKFITTSNSSGKSRGENYRGYLTDFVVNASQPEIDQSADDESNSCLTPEKKPSRNALNIDICRASKDVLDKDINLLVQDAETLDQSGKQNSTANNLGIFEEINMNEEELGLAISSQLAKVR